jgi:hypothetical protein
LNYFRKKAAVKINYKISAIFVSRAPPNPVSQACAEKTFSKEIPSSLYLMYFHVISAVCFMFCINRMELTHYLSWFDVSALLTQLH